jgi:hypothetical protein
MILHEINHRDTYNLLLVNLFVLVVSKALLKKVALLFVILIGI